MRRGCCRDVGVLQCIKSAISIRELPENNPRRLRSNSGQKLQHSEPGNSVLGILCPAKDAQDVLHMGCLEELQTPIFYERNVSSDKFDFERGAVMGGTKE